MSFGLICGFVEQCLRNTNFFFFDDEKSNEIAGPINWFRMGSIFYFVMFALIAASTADAQLNRNAWATNNSRIFAILLLASLPFALALIWRVRSGYKLKAAPLL